MKCPRPGCDGRIVLPKPWSPQEPHCPKCRTVYGSNILMAMALAKMEEAFPGSVKRMMRCPDCGLEAVYRERYAGGGHCHTNAKDPRWFCYGKLKRLTTAQIAERIPEGSQTKGLDDSDTRGHT